MSIPAFLLVHTATVTPYEGSGAYGDLFGEPFTLPCYIEQRRTLVTNPDGDQIVSETTVYADLTDTPIPNGSTVTFNGRTSKVITVSVFDDGGLTGLDHQEIALT